MNPEADEWIPEEEQMQDAEARRLRAADIVTPPLGTAQSSLGTAQSPLGTAQPPLDTAQPSGPRRRGESREARAARLRPLHEIGDAFSTATGIVRPQGRAELERLWLTPARELLTVCGDVSAAQALVTAAVREARGAKLTVSSPNSVLQIARALQGRRARSARPVQERAGGSVVTLPNRGGAGRT